MHRELKTYRLTFRCRKAVTLTEVIMASALLIVAIVPILKAMTGSHAVTAKVEQQTTSLTLAQLKTEQIRAASINDYDSSFSSNDTLLAAHYYCDVADTSVSTDLRKITVSVGYDDDGGNDLDNGEIDVQLVTLIARRID